MTIERAKNLSWTLSFSILNIQDNWILMTTLYRKNNFTLVLTTILIGDTNEIGRIERNDRSRLLFIITLATFEGNRGSIENKRAYFL